MVKVSENVSFSNPADGILDEEAERKAFQEAVMEWRRSSNPKQTTVIVRENESETIITKSKTSTKIESSTDMHISMSYETDLSSGMLDEEAERKAFQAAVMEWRKDNSKSNESKTNELKSNKISSSSTSTESDTMWNNPFNENKSQFEGKIKVDCYTIIKHHIGESLAIGTLDEEKEKRVKI